MARTTCGALTVDIELVALLSRPSHTGHLAGVQASIGRLRLRDSQVMSSLHILSLAVGQDGVAFSVPGDGGERHTTRLTLQCHQCVQQGCDLGGLVPTFDGRRNWRKRKQSSCCSCVVMSRILPVRHSPYTLRLKSLDCLPAVFTTLHWYLAWSPRRAFLMCKTCPLLVTSRLGSPRNTSLEGKHSR